MDKMKMTVPFSVEMILEYPDFIDWNTIPVLSLKEIPIELLVDKIDAFDYEQYITAYDIILNDPSSTKDQIKEVKDIVCNKIKSLKHLHDGFSEHHQKIIARGSVKLVKCLKKYISNPVYLMSLNLQITQTMIKAGFDADTTQGELGKFKETALIRSVSNGSFAVVRYLISKGADVNYMDSRSYTPVITAITFRRKGVLLELLKSKADPNKFNIKATDKFSPLVTAALVHNDHDAADTLLKFGADPLLIDGSGRNALNYAEEADNRFALSLFKGYI